MNIYRSFISAATPFIAIRRNVPLRSRTRRTAIVSWISRVPDCVPEAQCTPLESRSRNLRTTIAVVPRHSLRCMESYFIAGRFVNLESSPLQTFGNFGFGFFAFLQLQRFIGFNLISELPRSLGFRGYLAIFRRL